MSELSKLYPQPLWTIFSAICAIPHPSYHEEALASYIMRRVNEKGFWSERDGVGNILIRKSATAGMEKRKPVALQAHLDMVPQKNSDTLHDFTRDPIQPRIAGEWVKASGTTLGADNGIGMASALAVLLDDSVVHGPLEVLLTMTEEAGMTGAFGLQADWLQATILINTDSEEEGEIFIGCAGGIDVITTLPLQREIIPHDFVPLKLTVKGLKGGHSGCDIHLGLGNANKILAHFLALQIKMLDFRLIDFSGGTLRNAIPREACATLAVAAQQVDALKAAAVGYLTMLRNKSNPQDNQVVLLAELVAEERPCLVRDSSDRFVSLLNNTPDGVIHYADAKKSVAETSLNLGVVTVKPHQAEISCLIRSFIDSEKDALAERLISLADLAGGQAVTEGNYPGWQPDATSPVVKLVSQTYEKLFNRSATLQVIHAGLECGLFKKPYPLMDMVSIGPTIASPHSPAEQVHIESVGRYWKLLTGLLRAIPYQ